MLKVWVRRLASISASSTPSPQAERRRLRPSARQPTGNNSQLASRPEDRLRVPPDKARAIARRLRSSAAAPADCSSAPCAPWESEDAKHKATSCLVRDHALIVMEDLEGPEHDGFRTRVRSREPGALRSPRRLGSIDGRLFRHGAGRDPATDRVQSEPSRRSAHRRRPSIPRSSTSCGWTTQRTDQPETGSPVSPAALPPART